MRVGTSASDANPAPPFRYRNFRTFTSPRPTQFSCVAVDSSGEIVSAGAQDSFEIFIWSMQTGRLLEVREPLWKGLAGVGGTRHLQLGHLQLT